MIQMSTDTPHRRATATIVIMALATVIEVALPAPAARADHCEIVACWRECRPVPGGQWCRTMCRRRCWRSAPRYDPPPYVLEPQYEAPSYAPASRAGSDPFPALLLLGGVGIIVVLIVAALASTQSGTEDLNSATNETERQTAEIRDLVAKLEAATRDADDHLDRFLADTRHPPR